MCPRTTRSDAVATTELGSAAALMWDNAVPGQPCWQVRFLGHFRPRCCDGEAVSLGRNTKAPIILKYSLALIAVGLLALLGAGCQGGEADVKNQGGTPVEETGEPSSEVKQTLELPAAIIANTQKMQDKIGRRKEAYASTGDTQGEQQMGEAAETVGNLEEVAWETQELAQEAIEFEGGTTQFTAEHAFDIALLQAKNKQIEEIAEHLEDMLNEAKNCCGLEPDFLSGDLQQLRTQTDTLENLGKQITVDQTVPERAGPQQLEQPKQEKAAPQQPKAPPAPGEETPSKGEPLLPPKEAAPPASKEEPPPASKEEPLPPPPGL